MKKLIMTGLLLIVSHSTMAVGMVNDMQLCQGVIEFVDKKLKAAPAYYDKADVKTVRKGLEAYDQYIQGEIVAPKLLKFNGGDIEKARVMQKQVDAYKMTVVNQLNTRYPQPNLFTDHAISINDCAKKAVPSGKELDKLKDALNTMVKLAQLHG
ncbi:MAG: hypothetical protein ABJH06_09135 [Paraglaciecola sp.]|uniref:hypothetical protein n=1 Tax=Paraglaciecola sp. TaxID=1920173 RepID=UPI0032999E23